MQRQRTWQLNPIVLRGERNRIYPATGFKNLIRYSELQSISNTIWTGYTANKKLTNGGFSSTIKAPDGTYSMNSFTTTATNSGVYQVFSVGPTRFSPGETFTVSAWLAVESGTAQAGFAYYDGAFYSDAGFTVTTTPTRFSRTFTLRTSPAPASDSNVTVNANASGQTLLWWGYQLERGRSRTLYSKKL
jgi:ABC-type molybdate transport system substrate-binding protein